jgi:beta-carotene 3-hydroxylase
LRRGFAAPTGVVNLAAFEHLCTMLFTTLIVLVSFAGMEVFTAMFHRWVMHGLLWRIHRTHHVRASPSRFELNDVFVAFFTTSAMAMIVLGLPNNPILWVGVGIAVYGVVYFVVHDIIIHRRFARPPAPRNRYLRAVYRAHRAHHAHVTNSTGEAFGLLWVPKRYWSSSSGSQSPGV